MWPGARATYASLAVQDVAAVDLGTAPSGYAQLITGTTAVSPLPVSQNAGVGAFIRPLDVPLDAIAAVPGYVPAWAGDRIGRRPGGFAIGRGAIGHMRPTHGKLTEQGLDVDGNQLGYRETLP